LVIDTAGLALDDDLLANAQKRQENINVDVVVRQVADINLRSAGLRSCIPKNVAVTRITRSCPGVC
jgi:hypothetical protein